MNTMKTLSFFQQMFHNNCEIRFSLLLLTIVVFCMRAYRCIESLRGFIFVNYYFLWERNDLKFDTFRK